MDYRHRNPRAIFLTRHGFLPISQNRPVDFTDIELHDAEPQWKTRIAFIWIPFATVFGCIACLVILSTRDGISAKDFFEGRQLAAVVGEQYMKLGHAGHLSGNRESVFDFVQARFKQMSDSIRNRSTRSAGQLDSMVLSRSQRNMVVRVIGYMSDPRVQVIGHDIQSVAHHIITVRDGDRESLIHHLDTKLTLHLGDLRRLAKEIFLGHVAERLPSARHMHLVKIFDTWKVAVDGGAKNRSIASVQIKGRRLGEDESTLNLPMSDIDSIASVIMSTFAHMYDSFEAPQELNMDVVTCLSNALVTGNASCMFDSVGASFREVFDTCVETLGTAQPPPDPAPVAYMRPDPLPVISTTLAPSGGWPKIPAPSQLAGQITNWFSHAMEKLEKGR